MWLTVSLGIEVHKFLKMKVKDLILLMSAYDIVISPKYFQYLKSVFEI